MSIRIITATSTGERFKVDSANAYPDDINFIAGTCVADNGYFAIRYNPDNAENTSPKDFAEIALVWLQQYIVAED